MEREINTEERSWHEGHGGGTDTETENTAVDGRCNKWVHLKKKKKERKRRVYKWQTLTAIRGAEVLVWFPFYISLYTLSFRSFTTSHLFFHTISLHSYLTASLVSVSFRCHLVPLPLAQVSPALSVLACMRLCVGGLFHCYTAGAECCLRHMSQPNN